MLFSSKGLGMSSESYFTELGRGLAGTERSLAQSFNAHATGIFFFKLILLKAMLPATVQRNCIISTFNQYSKPADITGVLKPLCENLIMHIFSGGTDNVYVLGSVFFILTSNVDLYASHTLVIELIAVV